MQNKFRFIIKVLVHPIKNHKIRLLMIKIKKGPGRLMLKKRKRKF
jgi:hypothetical protein